MDLCENSCEFVLILFACWDLKVSNNTELPCLLVAVPSFTVCLPKYAKVDRRRLISDSIGQKKASKQTNKQTENGMAPIS